MEGNFKYYFSEKEKNKLINKLAPELPILRAKAEISQEELANIIGTSRQTYGAIERMSRKMTWNTFLTLIWFFDYNRKTHKLIRSLSAFPHELIKKCNDGDEPKEFELGLLFQSDKLNIIDSLDEKAFETIKTAIMIEYSRCNKAYGKEVIRFFEGIDITKNTITKNQKDTALAIKNIKEK